MPRILIIDDEPGIVLAVRDELLFEGMEVTSAAEGRSGLQLALQNRPELEAITQQLANDDTSVMLAGNNLKPDVSLSVFYASNGRGGVQIDNSGGVPVVVSRGGFLDSLDQLGSFNFPTYGVSLDLRLPLRNRAASAELGAALLTKKNDLYVLRRQRQIIDQDVRNAVHQLEQSKLI